MGLCCCKSTHKKVDTNISHSNEEKISKGSTQKTLVIQHYFPGMKSLTAKNLFIA